MSKKFTSIVVAMLAMLVLCSVPASAQRRPDPKTMKQSVLDRSKFSRKASKVIHSNAPMMKSSQRNLPTGKFVKQQSIMKASPKAAALNPLYGHMVYDSSWDSSAPGYGIYSIMPQAPANIENVMQHSYLDSFNGGAIIDNLYYVHYVFEFWGMVFLYRECYDLETGEQVSIPEKEIDVTDMAQCTSYDIATGLAYGIFYNEEGYANTIASYDYVEATKNVIGETANDYIACAVDGKGSLFAITMEGDLYKINLTNGEETLVGSTGAVPAYMQSAAIDPSTGKMYWAFLDGVTSALYEVNTETGAASEIFTFDTLNEIVCLQSMAPDAAVDAPAAVSDLVAELVEGSPNAVKVNFTMPSVTLNEDPLIGTLQYTVDLNGTVYTGEAQPGEAVSATYPDLETGLYTVVVRAVNAVGPGASAKTKLWVGPDVVLAPEFANLTIDENLLATVTWTPVTQGIHEGFVNPDAVTYRVVRYPEAVVVADGISETTFSETVSIDPLRVVYYEVSAIFEGQLSQPTATNGVKVGNALKPSYTYNFDGSQDGLWSVIDANQDFSSWTLGSGLAYYTYNSSNEADDWLLSPSLELKAGKKYLLSFSVWAASTYYPERIEVGVGRGEDVFGYDMVIEPTDVVWDSENTRTLSAIVEVDADGVYNIGLHAISDPDEYRLNISDFALIDGDTPGAVTNIVPVAGAEGSLNATINFTAPTLTCGGDALSSITKIEVSRGGQLVGTIENPAVGAELSVADEGLPESGIYTYTIQAFNEVGAGETVTTSVFVGVDIPAAPVVTAIDNMPGVTLMWEPVTKGVNGGYVDPTEILYEVYNVVDGSIGEMVYSTTGTSYVDSSADINEVPVGWHQYVVYAKNEVGQSSFGVGALVGGAPESLPFIDGFNLTDAGSLVKSWFVSGASQWGITSDMSSDDTGTCGFFTSSREGDYSNLLSQRVSMDGAAAPVALFKYYVFPGDDIKLKFGYDKQDGNGIVELSEVVDGKNVTEEGWQSAVVDLSSLVGSVPVVFAWVAEAGAADASVLVDEIRIGDVYEQDLAAIEITAPKAIQVGESGDVNVTVMNNGSQPVEEGDYSVKLFAGDKEVGEITETPALAPYSGKTVLSCSYVARVVDASPLTLTAEVVFDKDLDLRNNKVQTNVNIRQNKVPAVNDLTALTSGYPAVNLKWSAPKEEQGAGGTLITEDFEDQEVYQDCDNGGIDFDILFGHIGGWTLYNGDNYYSYGWNGVTFPGQDVPRSFIVFNPGNYFDLTQGSSLVPYSGDQYMLSHDAATDENYNPIPTDDWLISPQLSGNAQTISFYATEITDQYGHESYEVLYSSTDTNPESFTKLYDGMATTEWEEITVDLPAGAKYFAIRNISVDIFGLMIDDVTYEAAASVAAAKGADLEITGYNIYRDGELIATVDADVNEYLDVNETDGLHSYNVTVLYGTVESPLSNTVSVVTAIEEVQTAEGLNDADITVYGTNGAIIACGKGVYNSLRTGVYVIKNNETGAVRGVSKK